MICVVGAFAADQSNQIYECTDWQTRQLDWIFCDDFEDTGPMVASGRYFEYGDDEGDCVPIAGAGLHGSRGIRTIWQTGEVGAGGFKLGFGRVPSSYMDKGIRTSEDFREVYYRMYLKMEEGWRGNPAKLSRATILAQSNWSQAMIAHIWGGSGDELGMDPVRCIDTDNNVKCQGYNDFDHMDWLGWKNGVTPIFSSANDNIWHCVEAHVRLNDPGIQNGIMEFWIDGSLEAGSYNLDFVRSYTEYGINAIFFENYWNSGSPQNQKRYFDNIVVSTSRIGCIDLKRTANNISAAILPLLF